MVFTHIGIAKRNQGSHGHITEASMQELLLALNNREYCNRRIPNEGSYKTPENLLWDDNCHSSARKFAEVNNGWTRISGYIIKMSDLSSDSNQAYLWAHSVIEDTNGDLIELMDTFSPLEDRVFIRHSSGSQSYDLWAFK